MVITGTCVEKAAKSRSGLPEKDGLIRYTYLKVSSRWSASDQNRPGEGYRLGTSQTEGDSSEPQVLRPKLLSWIIRHRQAHFFLFFKSSCRLNPSTLYIGYTKVLRLENQLYVYCASDIGHISSKLPESHCSLTIENCLRAIRHQGQPNPPPQSLHSLTSSHLPLSRLETRGRIQASLRCQIAAGCLQSVVTHSQP